MAIPLGSGLDFPQMATPSTPSAGRSLVYVKSDGKIYTKNSAGAEIVQQDAQDQYEELPSWHGFQTWSIPVSSASAVAQVNTSGNSHFCKLWAPKAFTLNTITTVVTTGGATLTN